MNFKALLASLAIAASGFASSAEAAISRTGNYCNENMSRFQFERCMGIYNPNTSPEPRSAVAAPAPRSASRYSPGQQALLNSVARMGVQVFRGECEDDSAYGYFSYYAQTWEGAHIQLCSNVIASESMLWETLRHEAVHVAQKCNNRFHGNSFNTLNPEYEVRQIASQKVADFVVSAYPSNKWWIEIEAFTFQKYSNQFVANMVNKACK